MYADVVIIVFVEEWLVVGFDVVVASVMVVGGVVVVVVVAVKSLVVGDIVVVDVVVVVDGRSPEQTVGGILGHIESSEWKHNKV